MSSHLTEATSSPAVSALPSRSTALLEGAATRRHFQIARLGNGMLHTRVRGNRAVFERIGLSSVFGGSDPQVRRRDLAWLTLDRAHFALSIYSSPSNALIYPALMAVEQLDPVAGVEERGVAYINGGFFNHKGLADPLAPPGWAIGATSSADGPLPCLPLPTTYADDYHRLAGDDGSSLMCAPLLSKHGQAVFTAEVERDPRYQPPGDKDGARQDIQPGYLQHAAARHPRTAISYPSSPDEGNLRFIVGRVANREEDPDTGYSMAEWADACSWLDRRDAAGLRGSSRAANSSLNLDGGNSAAVGARVPGRKALDLAQSASPRPLANLVIAVQRQHRMPANPLTDSRAVPCDPSAMQPMGVQ